MLGAEIKRTKHLIQKLTEGSAVSGYEDTLTPLITEEFRTLADDVSTDQFGNTYALKKGSTRRHKIMLAAHSDEIGLMIKKIDERGFLRFTTVGGMDPRVLLSQEVIIHGRRPVLGVIGSMPPHLLEGGEQALKLDELGIDVGLSSTQIQEIIQVGDPVTLRRTTYELLNDIMAGKAMDDRAGIAVMAVCLEELSRLRPKHDVIAVATVQEEIGLRGALTSAYTLNPDLAVVIDVTHASTPDTKGQVNLDLGKGPAVALGPNVHPNIYRRICEAARLMRIPIQVEPIPGMSGTDAWVIQVTQAGIPTGLVSIPLRYMHTSVETLDLMDVLNAGKLLAYFIANLPDDLEEFLCY